MTALAPRGALRLLLAGLCLILYSLPGAGQESVSSDDISVAEGLQLPTFGHVWALDVWKGTKELVRLKAPDALADDPGFSLKLRRSIEFKGEAAKTRLHDASPTFFVRGVSGDSGRSDLTVTRVEGDGHRRAVVKEALVQLKQQGKHPEGSYPELISLKQQRIGATDWYRLSFGQPLAVGEYALLPLSGSQGFAEGEVFDFAIDPDAPENADPIRSEQYRGEK